MLLFVFLYLKFRKFDFRVFTDKIKFNSYTIFEAIFIFILASLVMDIYFLILNNLSLGGEDSFFDISLVIYSLLNGFYEEIFFLGICLAIKKEFIKFAFLYSLIIRFSFHTYQGLWVALGIGFLLGSLFFILYQKMYRKNL